MDKIASERDRLISQGVPSDEASVVALANSSFFDNMDLYFRLEQPVRSSEEIGALKIAVRLAKGMCQNESNSMHASKAADNLEEDALRKELEAQKEYAQKKIQQLQGRLKDVQADVNEKQDIIIQLQAEKKCFGHGDLHLKMQKQFRMLSWTRNIHLFSLRFIQRCQTRRTFKQFPVAKTSEWHLARINELLW